ncbi:MAG: DUF115 domain-containing protein [Spirochaetia bacterium]|nr:DUF115 domain-containing protein [Spirochaetia bacterium]
MARKRGWIYNPYHSGTQMERNREQSLQSILKRKPYLQIFSTANPGRFRLENTEYGQIILDERGRALSSSRPREEAKRLVPADVSRWTGREIILIQGIGNLELLSQVSSALKPDQICIAVDHRFDLASALIAGPLLEFLDRPGSHLFAGSGMLEYLRVYLESIPAERFRGVRRAMHAPSVRLEPWFYQEIEKQTRNILRAKMSDLLTRFEFEKTWLKHILINSRHLSPVAEVNEREGILAWKDSLRGQPGMLVAAGPSLRRSKHLLEAAHNKAFVLACDTSVKAMLGLGIRPHALCTLDAQKHTLFHFLGADLKDTILFADVVANPLVFRNTTPGGVVFSTTAKYNTHHDGTFGREATPGTEYAEDLHGPIGDLQSGGSVATTGFELLRFLGCDPILLIGLDMAYTGGEIHSTGTHHNEKWLTLLKRTTSLESINQAVFRKREIRRVPAVEGGLTSSDYVLDLYRSWFEDSIPKSGVRVIHLNPEGAVVENAERLTDPLQYLHSLPDLEKTYPGASPLQTYVHPGNLTLYGDLLRLADSPSEFFLKYPFTRVLLRRSEVYQARNREKLGHERSEKLRIKAEADAISFLKRALKPYFRPER